MKQLLFFLLGVCLALMGAYLYVKNNNDQQDLLPSLVSKLGSDDLDKALRIRAASEVSPFMASPFNQEEAALAARSGVVPRSIAQKEISRFAATMSAILIPTREPLGNLFQNSTLYDGVHNTFFDEINLSDLQTLYRGAEHFIIYPIVKGEKQALDFMYTAVDKNGVIISGYLDSEKSNITTSEAENYKQNMKRISTWYDGKVLTRLLAAGFYEPGKEYFSIKVLVSDFENWINKKNPVPATIRFYAGQYYDPKQRYAQFTVLASAYDDKGNIIAALGDDYFNITYPCPPPVGCR